MAKKLSITKTAKKVESKKNPTKKIVKKSAKPKPASKAIKKPAKKGKEKDDLMCFLTSACVNYYALPDNCRELNTLRLYRDNYLLTKESGVKLVKAYYAVAPKIVSLIHKDENKDASYQYIYSEITKACAAIENNRNMKAKTIYTNMVSFLGKKYKL